MLGKGGVGAGVSRVGECVVEGAGNLHEREDTGGDGRDGRDIDEILLRVNCREALRVLEKHVQGRLPYVECASRRLQAVMGVRNEEVFGTPCRFLIFPFLLLPQSKCFLFKFVWIHVIDANSKKTDLPSIHPCPLSPSIQKLFSTPNCSTLTASSTSLDAGTSALALARNGSPHNNLVFPLSNIFPLLSSNNNIKTQFPNLRSPVFPITHVNPKTGKGLREWLLTQGKETRSQRKLECRSVSFHDFRPELRTGKKGNILLGHYDVGGREMGEERVDVYEVDL